MNQKHKFYLYNLVKVASSKTIAVHRQCKVRRGHRSWFRIDSNQHKKPHHFHSVSLRSSLGSADAVCIDSGLAAICKKQFLVLEKKRYRKNGLRTSLACTLVLNSPSTELSRTMNLYMGHLFRQYLHVCHCNPSPFWLSQDVQEKTNAHALWLLPMESENSLRISEAITDCLDCCWWPVSPANFWLWSKYTWYGFQVQILLQQACQNRSHQGAVLEVTWAEVRKKHLNCCEN